MTLGPPRIPQDELSQTLAALADPTRRSILEQLSLGPASVQDLARPYDMSQPAVSKHIKVLEGAGLVSQQPGNRLGPRRLELAPFVKAAQWMDAYARIWDARRRAFSHPESAAPAAAVGRRQGPRKNRAHAQRKKT
jgi:DNA-binding transcriptional ArsR family regulator